MAPHRHAPYVIATAVIFKITGCIEVERPYPPPSADEIFHFIYKRNAAVRSLRAEARVTHRAGDKKVRATLRMMAATGGQVRFDAVSPFDTPLATLVAKGGSFALVDVRKNRHYHGPSSPCNLARLLRVQLSADEALSILGGGTPLVTHQARRVHWDGRSGEEVLTLDGEEVRQEIRLRRSNGQWILRASRVFDGQDRCVLEIVAEDHKRSAALDIPMVLAVRQPVAKSSLNLVFRHRETNIALPEAAFVLPQAGNMDSQHVTCQQDWPASPR